MIEPPRVRITHSSRLPQTGFFGRFVTLTVAGLLVGGALIAAITFSLILLPVVLIAGAIGFGYLWFKTRGVRRQFNEQVQAMQAQMARQGQPSSAGTSADTRSSPAEEGVIIDGDFIQEAPKRQPGDGNTRVD